MKHKKGIKRGIYMAKDMGYNDGYMYRENKNPYTNQGIRDVKVSLKERTGEWWWYEKGYEEGVADYCRDLYEELFPWITDGLASIQKKYGMTNGDCSPGLDMRFREVFQDLCECTYDQMVEHNIFNSNNNNERVK